MKSTLGALLTLAGTNITASYQASAAFPLGRAQRIRFYLKATVSVGSGITTTTVKLQFRYNDGSVTTAYLDLPSHLDDVAGAAQPKGNTFEIEHAFATPANAVTSGSFYLDKPQAVVELTVNMKANAIGQAGDSISVYGVAV